MVSTYQPSGTTYDPALEEEEIPVEEAGAAEPAPADQSSVDSQASADAAAAERERQAMQAQDAAADEVPVEEETAPAPADQSTIDYQAEVDAKAAARELAATPMEPAPVTAYDPVVDEATGELVADPRMAEQERANWEASRDYPNQTIEGRAALEAEGEQILAERESAQYGLDGQGRPLPSQQAPADDNILTRLTPFDEAASAIAGDDGFNLGDLNPINVVTQGLVGMGQGLDKGRQRVVEAMGEEAIDNIRKGRGETLPEESLADRVGGFLLNVPETLARLPLSKQSEDQIGDGGGYATWLNDPANADLLLELDAKGYNGFTGGRALWEYYVSDKTMAQRGLMDVLIDPLTPITAGLGGIAALGKGAGTVGRGVGVAAKAANVALDPIGEGILPIAGRAVRATGIGDKVADTPVGRLFQPSQSTQAEGEITGTAETLFGALEDADGNPLPANATQAAPAPAQAPAQPAPAPAPAQPLQAALQAAPPATPAAAGPPIPESVLVAQAPQPIIPVVRGGQIVGMRDLETGVERALSPNFDDDVPELLERLKLLPLGEYIPMRDAWFPSTFRNGLGSTQHLDAYYPSRGVAYDNYIDLMASRVRLWGTDAYDDMWDMWVTSKATARQWNEALHGIQTWLNVEQHSGVVDPRRDERLMSQAFRDVMETSSRIGLGEPQLWDPARLAGRPLPPVRNVLSSRRYRRSIPQAEQIAPPLPPELQPGPAAPAPAPAPAQPATAPAPAPAAAPLTPAMQRIVARATGQPVPNWRDRLTGARNNMVDADVTATLDRTVNGGNLGDTVWNLREDLLDVQQRLNNGATPDSDPVVAAMMQRLDGLVTPEQLKAVDRRGVNRIAAIRASLDQMGDQAFKDRYPAFFERQRRVDDLSVRGIVRGLTQELPAAVLYNPARILPFMTQQFAGNATTLPVAGQAGALARYANPRNNIAIFKRTRQGLGATADTQTEFDRILRTAGLPLSDTFRMGGPAGEQGATLSRQLKGSSIYQKMGLIIAPQPLRDLGGISDLSLREAVGTREFVRLASEARVPVADNADRLSGRFGVAVLPDQIRAAVAEAENAARRESGQPIFSANTLRQALEASGAQGADVPKWADRVARDYQQALKQAYAGAKTETERVGFSFKKTNADEALGKVLFFSYWNLRASNLYARSLMKNPALLASYSRGIEALNREAEDNQYPDYLRGWLRFMAEGGTNVYFDPRRSFSTLVTLADQSFRNPDGDLNRLTGLGRLTEALPGMVNPVLASMLYAMGAMGADASAPDPTGTGAMFRTGYDIFNLINVARGGERIDPKYRRPVQGFFNALASEVSDATSGWFDDLQRVERDNPAAAWEARVNWYTQEAIREDNPTWTEEQVLAKAAEVLGDAESEYVQEGIDRAARAPFEGIGSGIPVVGGLVGGVASNALGTLTRPEEQDTNLSVRRLAQDKDPSISEEEKENAYLARDIAQSAGREDIGFERGVDGFYDLASPKQDRANSTYKSIRYDGMLPGGAVEVAGQTFTNADIAGWDNQRRGQLAEAYLRERGEWKDFQSLKTAQDAYRASHPELREYFAFKDVVESYPGGPEKWAATTRQSNANLDQYIRTMENLDPERYGPGGSGRLGMLTDGDAYRAAYGIPRSLYDVPAKPGDSGYFVAGVPTGLTPSQAEKLGGGGEKAQGEGGAYNEEARQELAGDLGNYAGMVGIMNEYDAAVGNAPGTTQQLYNIKVITGDKGIKLPEPVYDEIKATYDYVFPSKGKFRDYLTWAVDGAANPDGSTSVDDFLDWDRGQYLQQELAKPATDEAGPIDITAGLRASRDEAGNLVFGAAPAPAAQGGQRTVTMRTTGMGLADPYNEWSTLLEVPPMLPLVPVSGYEVGPTANWQKVRLPDGTEVWVDAALLVAA